MGHIHGVAGPPDKFLRPKQFATAIGLSLLFMVVYSGCNAFTAARSDVGTLYFAWERHIPFVPILIIPYMSIDLFFFCAPFLCGSTRELKLLAKRITLGTGILQVPARTPALTAMTALTLAELSRNRFALGLGVSGPQVVEGLHGVRFQPALTRLMETVAIVRQAFRGEKLRYKGKVYELPRAGGEGKSLRVDHAPNPDIPIYLATLAPKSLEFTGAEADGWLGTSFSPDYPGAHFDHLRKGAASSGRSLDTLATQAATTVAIGDNVDELLAGLKPGVAFQLGAMGSAGTNFYNAAFSRAGPPI